MVLHSAPDRQPDREIRNARPARKPSHYCNDPVQARIVWDDTGEELWINTVAHGWSGTDIYVDATPVRPPYRISHVWLAAGDVKRR